MNAHHSTLVDISDMAMRLRYYRAELLEEVIDLRVIEDFAATLDDWERELKDIVGAMGGSICE